MAGDQPNGQTVGDQSIGAPWLTVQLKEGEGEFTCPYAVNHSYICYLEINDNEAS